MRALLIPLALVLLAACEQQRPATAMPPAAAATAPPGFACPAPGTRVEIRANRPETWNGADPADPAVCLVSTGVMQGERRLLGLVALPVEDERAWRDGMWALWPLEPDRRSTFTAFGRDVRGDRVFHRHEWRVEGTQSLRIGARTHDTIVLRVRTTHADGARGRHDVVRTIWLDRDIGVPVRVGVDARQGVSRDRSFMAREVEPPAR